MPAVLGVLSGEIERRLLVNYRVDPAALVSWLPAPFRPQLVRGFAVAGICLIRLGSMRPALVRLPLGLRSENAAHRIAVEWDTPEGIRSGVYIPRRDSSSLVNVVVGGRLYPGEHHRADFEVTETDAELRVAYRARDVSATVEVAVRVAPELVGSHLFPDVAAASAFFERGSIGYSATRDPGRFDGIELTTNAWRVEATEVDHVRSSFFDDPVRFPPGSAELDSALLMRHVPVGWQPLGPLAAASSSATPAEPSRSTTADAV